MFSLPMLLLWLTSLLIYGIFGLNGGDEARDGQFPYIVSLRKPFMRNHFCAGVIIGHEWILTAGHCVNDGSKDALVFPGTIHQKRVNPVYHTIRKIIVHPCFNETPVFIANDLALLQLKVPLNFSKNVLPISLGEVDDVTGVAVETAGWGAKYRWGRIARTLQHGLFQTMNTSKCQEIHDEAKNIVDGHTQICIFGGVKRSPCAGDSGGPLVRVDTRKLVGIFSGYEDCEGKYPALYVRLSAYIDWLRNVTSLELPLNQKLPPSNQTVTDY